jgi:hypothetical protein
LTAIVVQRTRRRSVCRPQCPEYTAQFAVGPSQLMTPRTPDLTYVFVVRDGAGWGPFLIVARESLREEHEIHKVGSVSNSQLILRFVYEGARVRCGKRSLDPFRSWVRWPILDTKGKSASEAMPPTAARTVTEPPRLKPHR